MKNFIIVLIGILQLCNGLPLLNKNESFENPFVGFFIFPHGGITLDPENMDYSSQPGFNSVDSKEKSIKLHKAMEKAAEALIDLKPDLIIFSTPHGFQMDFQTIILSAERTYGSVGSEWNNVNASFEIDTKLSALLFVQLMSFKNPVGRIRIGTDKIRMPLLWAEIIPWHFIQLAADKADFHLPKAIYIGQGPATPTNNIRNIGRDIAKTVLLQPKFAGKRIAVVISGDLSHLHLNDPKVPYPYSEKAVEFDKYIVNWAKLDRNVGTESESTRELLENAGKIQNQSGHCGYTGFVMVHGMLEELVHQNWFYKAKFYDYETPSYFGMMVASWIKQERID